ncbi:MAG: hypothetical protein WC277_04210, partial [Bacilli bacterium]
PATSTHLFYPGFDPLGDVRCCHDAADQAVFTEDVRFEVCDELFVVGGDGVFDSENEPYGYMPHDVLPSDVLRAYRGGP